MPILAEIFASLDDWVNEQNREANARGMMTIKRSEFRVVGQAALIDIGLEFEVPSTADLDAYTTATSEVVNQLESLLANKGMKYDLLSSEVWMPEETVYQNIFTGDWVDAYRAELEYVMLAKAKMSLDKNRILLQDYIASGPSDIFFQLCTKHEIDLGAIVGG